jgi:AraC family transcriptional regulator of adaptative response/methylated-DNA-[protein]-cysteine methyltransferase
MIDLQLDQGFESSSGFREAFAKFSVPHPACARRLPVQNGSRLRSPMLALANDAGLYLLNSSTAAGWSAKCKRCGAD